MPSPDVSELERLYQAWLRAEKEYRCTRLGSPEAQPAFDEVERVWAAYERELGRVTRDRGSLHARRSEGPV
ncbi:MAG TPA: hypothetical protein VID26_11580 [Candidatus Limnocylindrales bacterium]|jgi:hypothetical protein